MRITNLNCTIQDVLIELCDGNPGALIACIQLYKTAEEIDPDSALGGIGVLLDFDALGLYGSRIYMLWNDVCNRDPLKVNAVLRARQLGQLAGVTEAAINHAVDNRGEGIDMNAVIAAVKKRLPKFGNLPQPSPLPPIEAAQIGGTGGAGTAASI